MIYDGDGNRVSKTVAGVTTTYLVSEVNPTGYVQVMSERFSGGSGAQEVLHNYVYGLDRISQYRSYFTGSQSLTQISYYVYDGHGSVRALTDPNGNVTDTYDYDAFGNLTHSATTLSSPTPNEFLFAGEQYDSNLHLYYNRARYLDVATGRFWSMDTYDGDVESPLSLHKYLYAGADPVDHVDPSGHQFDIGSLAVVSALVGTVVGLSVFDYQLYKGATVGQAAKAGAIGFLVGAGITAGIYAIVWAGAIVYAGFVTGGLTFSLQVYNSFAGGQVNVVELEEDLPVVRYYGGQAAQLGRYWTTQLCLTVPSTPQKNWP